MRTDILVLLLQWRQTAAAWCMSCDVWVAIGRGVECCITEGILSSDEVQSRCEVIVQIVLIKLLLILDAVGVEVEALTIATYLLHSLLL